MKKYKVLGFAAVHYGVEYFRESLLSVKNHVDKMYVCYSANPSHGFGADTPCPDSEGTLKQIAEEVMGDKLIWETYTSFDSEITHRNMRYKYSLGYTFILTIDPDEVFDTEFIPKALDYAYANPQRYYGIQGYINFFRTFKWYFKDKYRPIRIEKLIVDNTDENLNCLLPVYHFSLCQREEVIRYKMKVFGHRNEIVPGYLERFYAWTPELKDSILNMHPTHPELWHKAEYMDPALLPEILKNHPNAIKDVKPRVLLIPLDYHRHTEGLFDDMIKAFKENCYAMMYNGSMMEAVDFAPDVIFFQGSLSPRECADLKERTKALFTMWTGDARYVPPKSFMDYKDIVDLFLVPFSGDVLDIYSRILGKPCKFIWEPIQDWRFKEPIPLSTGYSCFVGNEYETLPGGIQRVRLIKHLLSQNIDLKIYGSIVNSLGPLDYREVPDAYNKMYVVLAENNHDDLQDYFTPRNIGAMAAGSCVLHRVFPGIENHFQNGVHGLYYRNEYEAAQQITFLNDNPEYRNMLAQNGYKLACEKFSYKAWVAQYLQIIK